MGKLLNITMDKIAMVSAILFLGSCNQTPRSADQDSYPADSMVVMDNGEIELAIDLRGGHYVNFELKENPVNPFGWKLTVDAMPLNNRPFVFQGHFLCTGRWGSPSPGEIAAGIPHNGEVNTQRWKVQESLERKNGAYRVALHCPSPLEKLEVTRKITMPEKGSYFLVQETFSNLLPVGRPSNVVQHGTIAYPLLDATTLINTNAKEGFDQRTNFRYLEDSSFLWPEAVMADGAQLDLRKVTSEKGYVTTHIFSREDSLGWVTATNAAKNVLFGYVWKTREYPWLNVWHHYKEGRPYVQGLEFGTTGLGQPYVLLLNHAVDFHGRKSFEYMDAGETKSKSWICFQVAIPSGFKGVKSIEVRDREITITGRDSDAELHLSGEFEEFLIKKP